MYNKTIMVGNLTKDIALTYLASGVAVAKSSIATSYKYKAQSGEQKEEVCFLEFSMFGRGAEVANQYLHKGSKVLLEGRLVFEQWTDKDGKNRSRHSLRVDEMKMLDSKPNDNQGQRNMQGPPTGGGEYINNRGIRDSTIPEMDLDSEIPFSRG